ncbi:MAG TPA: TetR/AcrR family transcriptional regulator [Acidimicrobiia bacterium]|nr:TetR/AcrR family transcriptional regulator [Acidimicrobiia bacterium]
MAANKGEAADEKRDGGPETLSRIERKRLRRVNEILRVAAEVVGERGYQNSSLDEVAERLDLAKASLYYYFDSKQALVAACLDTAAVEVERRLEAIVRAGGTPTETLRRLIVEQQIFTTQDRPELSRLFLRHLEWPAPLLDQIHEILVRHDRIWKQVIEEGIEAGEFAPTADLGIVRHCIHGALDFVPFWYHPDGKFPAPELFEQVADTVLLMLGVEPGQPGARSAGARQSGAGSSATPPRPPR